MNEICKKLLLVRILKYSMQIVSYTIGISIYKLYVYIEYGWF